jgi:predicted transcriptional regulator
MGFKIGDALTGKVNDQGKVIIAVDGKESVFVPESDLLQIKSGLEPKINTLSETIKQLTTERDTEHNNLVQLQASQATELGKYKDFETIKTQVTDLTAKMVASTESSKKMEEELVQVYTSRALAEGIPADKIKGKTIQELKSIFSTLDLLPKDHRVPVFDRQSNGNGSSGGADIRSIIERAKERK